MLGTTLCVCYFGLQLGKANSDDNGIQSNHRKAMRTILWLKKAPEKTTINDKHKTKTLGPLSFFQQRFVGNDLEDQNIHEDVSYISRYGWIAARFRRTRWWFPAAWVIYQFVRACFIGGARGNPTGQVFGIFIWEIITFVSMILIDPFESARNRVLAVYMLGSSKVATAGLSIAFLPQFKVARIRATAIGIVIIVIQALLVIGVMILIVLGAISTYMSVTRNKEHIRPRDLDKFRWKYFDVIQKKAADAAPPPPVPPKPPKAPHFAVLSVRRAPKIEDEEFIPGISPEGNEVRGSLSNRASRAGSIGSYSSGNVPFGARVHRASWSSRDFQIWHEERSRSPLNPASRRASAQNAASATVFGPPLAQARVSQSSLRLSASVSDQPVKPASRCVSFAE